MTILEAFLADLNSRLFLKEFSFRDTAFLRPGVGTAEVADHVVWIDDLLFLFQLKDRKPGAANLIAWLNNKVLSKATKQIRATLALADSPSPVPITNGRGDSFDFTRAKGAHAYKVVIFRLPLSCIQASGPRFHVSSSVGFIHIFNWVDYLELVNHLITAIELADYLTFRESLLVRRDPTSLPSEGALLGQYLLDEYAADPAEKYAGALFSLIDTSSAFDLTGFLDGIASRIDYTTGSPKSYYRVIAEFSKLSRIELTHLKKRLALALDAARSDHFERPFRLVAQRTDCGFLVIPLTRDVLARRRIGLENLTRAAKYDQRTSRQVGISIIADGDDVLIDLAFLEGPWMHDELLERHLADNPPFRPLGTELQPRYQFSTEHLRRQDLVE